MLPQPDSGMQMFFDLEKIRHCEARSDAAIQSWIATAFGLAMTE
jgi:hypothetical protein